MKYDYSLGYVIGVLNGDGSMHRSIDYHYFDHKGRQVVKAKSVRRVPRYRFCLELEAKDPEFVEAFAEHLEKVTGKKPSWFTTKDGRYYRAKLVSKEWFDRLLPLKTELEWLKTADVEVKRAFLRGMFDSDGSIEQRKKTRRLTLTKSKDKLEICVILLHDFGIDCAFPQKIPDENCYRIRINSNNEENIEKFKVIGFYIKRKREILESSA